jgi:hypothetical protein
MGIYTPININLGILDIGTGGNTIPVQICFDYNWSILPIVTGTPGNAKYTLWVSHTNDIATFKEYKSGSTLVDIIDAIQDKILPFTWVYIEVQSGGASAGTAQFSMELKNN